MINVEISRLLLLNLQSFLTELKDDGVEEENQTFSDTPTTIDSSAGSHDNGNFVSNHPEVQLPRNLSVLYEDLEREGDETAFPAHRHRVGQFYRTFSGPLRNWTELNWIEFTLLFY